MLRDLEYKHKCFKCGKDFVIKHIIETDKPTCNKCFAKLLKIKSADEYYNFIK